MVDEAFMDRLRTVTAAAARARALGSSCSSSYPSGIRVLDTALYGEPSGADYAAENVQDFKHALINTAESGSLELSFNTYSWGGRARQGFADELMKLLPGLSVIVEGKVVKARWHLA